MDLVHASDPSCHRDFVLLALSLEDRIRKRSLVAQWLLPGPVSLLYASRTTDGDCQQQPSAIPINRRIRKEYQGDTGKNNVDEQGILPVFTATAVAHDSFYKCSAQFSLILTDCKTAMAKLHHL